MDRWDGRLVPALNPGPFQWHASTLRRRVWSCRLEITEIPDLMQYLEGPRKGTHKDKPPSPTGSRSGSQPPSRPPTGKVGSRPATGITGEAPSGDCQSL